MKKYKLPWLFTVITLSIIFGVIYKVGRISLDSSLHDPLTYEAINKSWELALAHEKTGELKAPLLKKIDVEYNLDSFITVYDKDKKVVNSSGQIDGATPNLPPDILDHTVPYVRNYFDWWPKKGVHVAGTTVALGDYGYVLAGRNMQEADRQGNRVTKAVVVGWAASVVVVTFGFVLMGRRKRS
jgi:hypothetical protein